jgi:hypothetical protein
VHFYSATVTAFNFRQALCFMSERPAILADITPGAGCVPCIATTLDLRH